MMELRNRRVLVVGLARTGRAVAQRFRREGAIVTATDLRSPASFGSILHELMDSQIGFELGVHREETFVRQDLIVVSPGVPWHLPQLEAARRRGVTVVPEVEAASWFFHGTLVGITGTNGKTTTTTLLGQMLEASDFSTYVAGNIGVPLISAVDLFSPESIVVAELSSFQLEAIQHFRPHVAVLLNVSENHLDRHETFAAYVSAKAQIFRNQQPDDFAVLNADDPVVMGLAPVIASRKVFFSREQDLPEGVLLSKGRVLYRVGHLERMLLEEQEVRLRGAFNVQNVMAAAAAACVLGADFKAIRSVAREFAGVEHRLEFVKAVRGIDFYNDSKATSVDAAVKALSTFDRGVHLILGGKDKGAPYTPLRPVLEGRVKTVYLIGSAAERIAEDLAGTDLQRAGDLRTAVQIAFSRAIPGDVVLLSPACSSYDQFENFEERGKAFKELVNRLPQTVPVPAPVLAPLEPVSPLDCSGTEESPGSALASVAAHDDAEEAVSRASTLAQPSYIFETEALEVAPAEDSREAVIMDEDVPEVVAPSSSEPIGESDELLSPYEVPVAQHRFRQSSEGGVVDEPARETPESGGTENKASRNKFDLEFSPSDTKDARRASGK
ncbi:MAG TPA: UDP-N-acetylmuramoyl-L-alanine--D-glutamate ligase [Terriglobia bacterium]|nr:UDP-N-acetylmuramoyl-L-alanine--D-glutamate ligase [Terriglobia bacterium]